MPVSSSSVYVQCCYHLSSEAIKVFVSNYSHKCDFFLGSDFIINLSILIIIKQTIHFICSLLLMQSLTGHRWNRATAAAP